MIIVLLNLNVPDLLMSMRNTLWGNLLLTLSQSLSFFVMALVFWYGAGLVSCLEALMTVFFVALMVQNYTELHLSSIVMSLRAQRWVLFRPGTSSHLYQTYHQQAAQVLASSTFSTQFLKSTQTPRLDKFLILRPPKATFNSRTFVFNTRHVLQFLSSVISLWKLSQNHMSEWLAPAVQGKALCKNYPSKTVQHFRWIFYQNPAAQEVSQPVIRGNKCMFFLPMYFSPSFVAWWRTHPGTECSRIPKASCIGISGTPGRTGYLANGHMSRHMLIGGINALPCSSHLPTMYI